MNLHAVSTEHTLDLDRLTSGGWVLDVGCRFFDLTAELVKSGCRVLAIDPSSEVTDPGMDGVVFERCALVGDAGLSMATFCDNKDAAHLVLGHRAPTVGVPHYTVPCATVEGLMRKYGIVHFEAVKLDCEGAEFDILSKWPGPVATQVTCAFHDFVNPAWCQDAYPALLAHLSQWYVTIQHQSYVRHGHAIPCYWDSLFILK